MRSNTKTKLVRDPFTFSLRGARAANSLTLVPVIPDDRINRAWDARLGRSFHGVPGAVRPPVTHQVETLLARSFAPGCCAAG